MARKIEKVQIPISLTMEDSSLKIIKDKMNSLKKDMSSSYGKDLIDNFVPKINDAIKKANKDLGKFGKPVGSEKEAFVLGENVTKSFSNLKGIFKDLKGAIKELFDPAEAQKMSQKITEITSKLKKLENYRNAWSSANSDLRSSGNKGDIKSAISVDQKRQKELLGKDKLNKNEAVELALINSRLEENVKLLNEKAEIEAKIESIKAESGFATVGALDAEIAKEKANLKQESDATLSETDYNAVVDALKEINQLLLDAGAATDNLGERSQNAWGQKSEFVEFTNEKVNELKSSLRQMIGFGFGVNDLIRGIKTLTKEAFNFYQSLDQALTDITIVSNMSRSQVLELTKDFINLSAQTGMAIDDIAKASVIFFQQGLNTKEVMEMTEVTAQFAKVAGSTVEKAADQLTAAVNGFKVGVEGAVDVADKLNAVAAKSAASIDELATAMSKAASQANQAGLSMDKFYAIIGTIEEVTREAPENIGTSLKTIMARMQQIKEGNNTEDDTDVNAVETALKTVGIALRDTDGQLRDLEDILDELGPRWNTLDRNTQAYLGTIIAGTRQQSRFISMMQNWDRVLELTEVSENSAGQQALMHKKAMEGLDASLNMVKNSWQEFLTTLTNSNEFIAILDQVAKILNNISKNSSLPKLLANGANFFMMFKKSKIIETIQVLGKNMGGLSSTTKKFFQDLAKNGKFFSNMSKETKSLNNEFTRLNKLQTETIPRLEEGIKVMSADVTQRQRHVDALRNDLDLGDQTDAQREETIKLIREEEAVIQEETEAIERRNISLNNAYNEEEKLKNSIQSTVNEITTSVQIAQVVLTFLNTVIDLLGLTGDGWVSLAMGVMTAAVGIVAAIKILKSGALKAEADIATKAPLIYALLTGAVLAITGIVAIVKAIDQIGDHAGRIKEINKEFKELQNNLTASSTKEKGLQDMIDQYKELNNKIYRTAEEQEELNELIENMADLADVPYTTDAFGRNAIDIKEVEDSLKMVKDETNELVQDTLDKANDARHDFFTADYGVPMWMVQTSEFLQKEILGRLPYIGVLFKQMGHQVGVVKEQVNERAYEQSKSYYSGVMKKNLGTSDTTTNALRGNRVDTFLNSDTMKALGKKGKQKDIDAAIKAEMERIKEMYNNEKIKKLLDNSSKDLLDIIKTQDDKTLTELKEEIDVYYNKLLQDTSLTDEERQFIEEEKSAATKFLMQSLGFENVNFDEIEAQYGTAIANMMKSLNGGAINALNSLGAFNGPEGVGILNAILPDIDKINEAFSQGGEAGAIALYNSLQNKINELEENDPLRKKLEETQDQLLNNISASADKTWGQVSDGIEQSTEKLRTMNSLMESLNENGGWTLEEFGQFADLLDSIDMSNMDPKELDSFTKSLENLDLKLDASKGLITANKDAVASLKDMQMAAAKSSIKASIDELKAKQAEVDLKIKYFDAEIEANNAVIDYLSNTTEEAITLDDLKAQGEKAYAVAKEQIGSEITKIDKEAADSTYQWSHENIEAINDTAKAWNQYITGLKNGTTIDIKGVQLKHSNIKWSGGNVADTLAASLGEIDEIKGLTKEQKEKAIEAYKNQNKKLKDQRKQLVGESRAITGKITLLENLYNSDLSKLGSGGGGGGGSKAAEAYISQLEKLLDLITHIDRETKKLNIFKKIYPEQTGKQNVKNLETQIELTEHLMNDYEKMAILKAVEVGNAASELQDKFGNIITFGEDGSYAIDYSKYDKLKDKQKEQFDEMVEGYKKVLEEADNYYESSMDKMLEEKQLRQEYINKYIEAENQLVEAIKSREKKILDAKLKAIDKEIEAIEKVSEARRKAREEEKDAEEMSGLQVDLQRALMDSSGASASQILSLQKQIKDKQKEMADNSFDTMVNDMKQQLEDEKEMEQALFDERLEEMDWYWAEVDRIMGEGVQSVLDTMKLYSDEYNQASEIQQTETLKGWTNTFEQAEAIGKAGAQNMQNIVAELQGIINSVNVNDDLAYLVGLATGGETIETHQDLTGQYTNMKHYASGGMNYRTGLAWLDGTRSNPEAVLNAAQTKAFLSFTDDLAALRASGAITNNSNVVIDTISFNVESMSSPEDGEKAFDAFVNRFKQIGAKQGISVNGTANRF